MLVAPLWCDLGCCSRTVVVIKAAPLNRSVRQARHQPLEKENKNLNFEIIVQKISPNISGSMQFRVSSRMLTLAVRGTVGFEKNRTISEAYSFEKNTKHCLPKRIFSHPLKFNKSKSPGNQAGQLQYRYVLQPCDNNPKMRIQGAHHAAHRFIASWPILSLLRSHRHISPVLRRLRSHEHGIYSPIHRAAGGRDGGRAG